MVMATFVPGFVSQALRNWLKRSRDAYGKAPRRRTTPRRSSPRSSSARGPRRRRRSSRSPITSSISSRPPGLDHVGIGSDFFGGPQPLGLEHVGRFPHLFAELLRRGFSEADLAKIASGNALRAMRGVEEVGQTLTRTRQPVVGRLEDFPGA